MFSLCALGQTCTAGSRIFVQEGIYDKFLEAFTGVAQWVVSGTGDPFGKSTEHGPQISKTQFDVSLFLLEVLIESESMDFS